MNRPLIFDNLVRLDSVNDFISILEVKFQENHKIFEKIILIKALINHSLMDFIIALDIDNNKLVDKKIFNKITESIEIFKDPIFTKEIKNFDLFLSDLDQLADSFSKNEDQIIKCDDEDIINFKEKKLSILAKKFN